jgi:hypothetical protein
VERKKMGRKTCLMGLVVGVVQDEDKEENNVMVAGFVHGVRLVQVVEVEIKWSGWLLFLFILFSFSSAFSSR